MITKIENYYLNQHIDEASDLREFSIDEYKLFEGAGYKYMVKDEKIFKGGKVNFASINWDEITIATTGNKVYKIHLQFITKNMKLAKIVFTKSRNYIAKQMGRHKQHPFLSKKYIWKAPEENLIIDQQYNAGQYIVNIIIRSNTIGELTKDPKDPINQVYPKAPAIKRN